MVDKKIAKEKEEIFGSFVPYKKDSLRPVLESLAKGVTMTTACKSAGIDIRTLEYWRQKYPKVDEVVKHILRSRIRVVEDSLYAAAVKGNITAQIFWLCNRAPGEWTNVHKIEHKGKLEIGLSEVLNEIWDHEDEKRAGVREKSSPTAVPEGKQ